MDGESKKLKGGINAVRCQTRCIPIHYIAFFDVTLNVYRLILDYFAAQLVASITCDLFLLSVNNGEQLDIRNFVGNQPLGKSTCDAVVKSVCLKPGIRGTGEAAYMTTHGLSAAMISSLIAAGHLDAPVVLRSGH